MTAQGAGPKCWDANPGAKAPPTPARGRQRPGQSEGQHLGARQCPSLPTRQSREQGPQGHQLHPKGPPRLGQGLPPTMPTETPPARQEVLQPQSSSLSGQGPGTKAPTSSARSNGGHPQPPQRQPPSHHILQGRDSRPPRAPDRTRGELGPAPSHFSGARPSTRRPSGARTNMYPGR